MKYRIAIWASAGYLVSGGWGLYFANADKANPIEPIVYTLARLTQPVVAITVAYFNFPLGLRWTMVANAVTYALVGLIVETIRQHYRPLQMQTDPLLQTRQR
jgi:hypothetical protein